MKVVKLITSFVKLISSVVELISSVVKLNLIYRELSTLPL